MTKKKGPKKAKTEFTVKRIERKKTRHLKNVAPATTTENKAGSEVKSPEPTKA